MTSPTARILVVDDHAEIREPMAELLERRGFQAGTAADGREMKIRLASDPYDLVLLDVMLPDESGFALCRQLQAQSGPPVILLTAVGETAQRVEGLEAGAEDYVVKPFEPAELLARIRTVLRRVARPLKPVDRLPAADQRVRFDDWTFDPLRSDLSHADGRVIALTTAESRLLMAFVRHPGEVLSRDRLLDLCAGADADVFDRSIDSQVSRLRRKLEVQPRRPRLLKTAWGSGYLFSATVVPAA